MYDRIDARHDELVAWRRDFHRHPELAFEEARTSDVVAEKLAAWGLEVHRGLAKTGVVGSLRAGTGTRRIGLRADMDALPIAEANTFEHRSQNPGVMHACGHDGHTTMLLGAARYLAETGHFDGTVDFIFQPAEENYGGGRVMIEEGLFERFPVQDVYGMHNWPGMPVGCFGMRAGVAMAAYDTFEIAITGKGAHAARPDDGIDPVLAGAEVVGALQSIVARNVSPLDSAVVSVTQFHGGDAYNVIPESVVLRGCTRSLTPEVRDQIEAAVARVVEGACAACGATAALDYRRGYPVTVNGARETEIARGVCAALVGAACVDAAIPPTMGSEDFGFMLEHKPGAYIVIGNGDSAGVHNPHYEFDDRILTLGAKYWVHLVETQLACR